MLPHIVVESSANRFHVYWKVSNFPLDQFEGVQKRLAKCFGGDNVHDLPRVLRLPGFIHHKVRYGAALPPFVTRIVRVDDQRPPYKWETLSKLLPNEASDHGNGRQRRSTTIHPQHGN